MKYISKLIIFVRSFFFCLKYLPLNQAIKVPIFVGKGIICNKFEGKIIVSLSDSDIRIGMIKLGVSKGSFFIGGGLSYLIGGGEIVFFGAANY